MSSKRETRESKEAKETKEEFKAPHKFKFQEGEKVLCFHGPLIYEAKCLQSRFDETEKVNQYHIHYSGWNKSWDEWVPESRVLKYNETNLQKQKELHKAQKAEPKGKRGKRRSTTGKESPQVSKDADSRSSTPIEKVSGRLSTSCTSSQESSSDVPRRKRSRAPADPTVETSPAPTPKETKEKKKGKASIGALDTPPTSNNVVNTEKNNARVRRSTGGRGQQQQPKGAATARQPPPPPSPTSTLQEERFLTKLEVKIKIPDELKPILVDDWTIITKQNRFVKIPCEKYTVDVILEDYTKLKRGPQTISKEDARIEVTDGIREYFNAMCTTQLLYKPEQKYISEIMKQHPGTPASELFGFIHLLRLFVKIGCALVYTRVDEKTILVLISHFNEFLKFLVRNSTTYFNPTLDYTPPSSTTAATDAS